MCEFVAFIYVENVQIQYCCMQCIFLLTVLSPLLLSLVTPMV